MEVGDEITGRELQTSFCSSERRDGMKDPQRNERERNKQCRSNNAAGEDFEFFLSNEFITNLPFTPRIFNMFLFSSLTSALCSPGGL